MNFYPKHFKYRRYRNTRRNFKMRQRRYYNSTQSQLYWKMRCKNAEYTLIQMYYQALDINNAINVNDINEVDIEKIKQALNNIIRLFTTHERFYMKPRYKRQNKQRLEENTTSQGEQQNA